MNTGIRVYVCPKCNRTDFLEAETCPRCSSELKEVLSSGRGKVVTFTVIRYPPEGFEKDSPYVVALVDLEEGPRVIGRITGDCQELRIEQPVQYAGNIDGILHFRV